MQRFPALVTRSLPIHMEGPYFFLLNIYILKTHDSNSSTKTILSELY